MEDTEERGREWSYAATNQEDQDALDSKKGVVPSADTLIPDFCPPELRISVFFQFVVICSNSLGN